MDAERLKKYGINYEKGLERFMGDRRLYESVLLSFLHDTTIRNAEEAFRSGDYSRLFYCTHELKGACGNADITTVYNAACELVELLRANTADDGCIERSFLSLTAAYKKAADGIRSECAAG